MRLVASILLAAYFLNSTVQLLGAECSGSYLCQFQNVCGISEGVARAGPYIINGTRKLPNQFPWTAQVVIKYHEYAYQEGTGTLISDRHILTSSHLFEGGSVEGVYVFIGTDRRYGFQQKSDGWLEAESFCVNPWKKEDGSDWATVRLQDRVEFSARVRPACVPQTQESSLSLCYLAGAGYIDAKETPSRVFNIMQVGEYGCPGNFFSEYRACVRGVNKYANAKICHGDSGAGLVCMDEESRRWQVRGNVIAYIYDRRTQRNCTQGTGTLVVLTKRKALDVCAT